MAEKTKMTDREKDIAAQIRGACSQIVPDVDTINDHKDAAKSLGESLNTSKLSIMAQVAEMSSMGKWLPGEIKNATAYASTTMSNAEPGDRSAKSLATFLSEMNAVAHPKVRDRFSQILGAVEDAWAIEDEAMKLDAADRPKMPVRKWASRKYHAITQVLRAVKNGEANISSKEDVIAYAEEHDPDFNPERVAKRLESVANALQGIFVDFDNDDVGRAHRLLATITAEDLQESLKAKLAKARKAAKEHAALKPTIVASNNEPASRSTPEPVPTTIEPAEGVFDVLNDDTGSNPSMNELIEELAA